MCYSVEYLTRRKEKYIKHYEGTKANESSNHKVLSSITHATFVNAFLYPKLPVLCASKPDEFQFFQWGLLPAHLGEQSAIKRRNYTFNARSETITEKDSFKRAVKQRRCIVVLDSFYEFHHKYNKKYLYNISVKSDQIMSLAGIYEERNGQGSVSIVTTAANTLISEVQNKPAYKDARMPVILDKERMDHWLVDKELTRNELLEICATSHDGKLEARTMEKVNLKELYTQPIAERTYPELNSEQTSLF